MKLTRFLPVISVCLCFAACGDDAEDPIDPGSETPAEPTDPGGDGPATPGVTSTLDANVTEDTTLSGAVRVVGLRSVSAALVIEAGAVIEFDENAGLLMEAGGGSLACNGTEDEPVTLRGVSATPGFWEALVFDSNDSANVMTYCNVSHGGSGSSFGFSGNQTASIIVNGGARLDVSNSRVASSEGDGILFFDGAAIEFASNAFADNGESPVRISANDAGALDNATDYGTSNGDNFIEVTGRRATEGQVWSVTTVPYKTLELLELDLDGSDALAVSPGGTLLMAENAGIAVNTGSRRRSRFEADHLCPNDLSCLLSRSVSDAGRVDSISRVRG
ncbi:MAG: right-handed parallel beta-helix repeat-containing protein [Myxococcota bacterium]